MVGRVTPCAPLEFLRFARSLAPLEAARRALLSRRGVRLILVSETEVSERLA